MSGHSKWNNIKARKGKSDAERSKIFTKIGREIMVAVKEGGANVESNSKLKMAIAKARQFNMPNDRINSVITNRINHRTGSLVSHSDSWWHCTAQSECY